MMKTLIRKELRENITLAAIGLALALLSLGLIAATYIKVGIGLGIGAFRTPLDLMQPLTSELVMLGSAWLCAIFGATLGWLQIQNERQRDLWAFLVHRPMPPTSIFLGKAVAGLASYFAALGAPLMLFVLWLRFFGPRVAPFEWAMVLPVLTSLLAGVVYYFAGMLVSLRQVRWYGSRGLPLLLALGTSAFVAHCPDFWMILAGVVVSAAVLGLACWGAFHTHGQYRGQPALAKLALTGSMTIAGFIVCTVIAGILLSLYFAWGTSRSSSSYTIARDGAVYKAVHPGAGPTQIVDLQGNPVKDPATGRKIDVLEFNRNTAQHTSVSPVFDSEASFWGHLRQRFHFFFPWRITEDTAWYFWRKYGRLVGYDLKNQRLLGSLGPDGFAPGSPAGRARFRETQGYYVGRTGVLCTETVAYRVDVETRECKPILTTTPEDPIGGAQHFLRNNEEQYTTVVTKHSINLLTPDGKLIWKEPYKPGYPEYSFVQVYFLEPAGRFIVWLFPSDRANARAGWKLPIQVTWVNGGQGAVKTASLPVLGISKEYDWQERMLNVFRPVVSPLPGPLASRTGIIDWKGVLVSAVAALLLFVPVTWWLGSRYALALPVRITWAIFVLLTGFPGLIGFLSVQEWPAREPCHNCREPRVVDRPYCEHCGADFPPPAKIGTEIFAPAGAIA